MVCQAQLPPIPLAFVCSSTCLSGVNSSMRESKRSAVPFACSCYVCVCIERGRRCPVRKVRIVFRKETEGRKSRSAADTFTAMVFPVYIRSSSRSTTTDNKHENSPRLILLNRPPHTTIREEDSAHLPLHNAEVTSRSWHGYRRDHYNGSPIHLGRMQSVQRIAPCPCAFPSQQRAATNSKESFSKPKHHNS